MITEPDVALTDWALAALGGACAWRLRRESPPGALRAWLVLFFASIAVAALLGGLVHGFFLDEGTRGARLLWPASLLAVGLTALAAWAIGARLAFHPPVASGVTAGAVVVFAGYAALVVLWKPLFALAVAHYLPAALFLLVVLALAWRRTGDHRIGAAVGGLAVILAGSWLQRRGIGLPPLYVTPNALYHVVEMAGLVLLFVGARRLAAPGGR